ncbi:sarcosine oxidase, gamma subunit family, heterotetrameric form [Arboricoccus pini]|uniref:Sarcosine oxidase, gamma subunit family, heterotetrameric form n=1 Tax=Arboricoccus pini TaxID=1963835 RepID=A0A212RP16_9PROT|nr:hypothetical protein [Arboricoccus pini]SNB74182.1 sarcosine oxidase, gamma subunit family, heterotetrameric form [Arboricoccus pini]
MLETGLETAPKAGLLHVEIRDEAILLVMAAANAAQIVAAQLGLRVARASRIDGVDRVAIAPGKWLILGGIDQTALARQLGEGASILDMDSAYVCLSLTGGGWRRVLASGAAIDVERLAPGDAAVTAIAGINVVLWLTDADRLELAVTRSYYRSFLAWLKETAGPDGIDAT